MRARAPRRAPTWRYLFNRAGDLAAVRDPRGCGQNFFYDLGGRLIGEQYVSCSETVSSRAELGPAIVPVGAVSMLVQSAARRVDVRYYYDAATPHYPSPPNNGGGMEGRATGVADRAQRSALSYDRRGNVVWTARQVSLLPDAPALAAGSTRPAGDDRPSWTEAPIAANRYVTFVNPWYARTARFDHAGRGTALLLPTHNTWGSSPPAIGGVLTFNRRGLPATAGVTIGCNPVTGTCSSLTTREVVHDITYERDGLPSSVTWGDAKAADGSPRDRTVSRTRYDVRRRPIRMTTDRQPTGMDPQSPAAVSTVVDQQLVWDAASNLTETIDHRDPTEWPAGHLPQSTIVMHDALYRVTGAFFSYTQPESGARTTENAPTDWRQTQAAIRGDFPAEGGGPSADPMDVVPAPMLQDPGQVPGRVIDLEWSWDWLGNSTSWNDDAGLFYERSIGAIGNGVDRPATEDLRPSALYIASNIPTATMTTAQHQRAGWTELEYGAGGNVLSMTVHGQCADRAPEVCTDDRLVSPGDRADHLRASCLCANEQYYQYRWDELNRLAEARRWDRTGGTGAWSLEVRQRYRYDGGNVRVIKATIEPTAESQVGTAGTLGERIALYIYPGDFEVRGFQRSTTSNAYIARTGVNDHVETQYVVAGARLVWRNVAGSELLEASNRRLTVPLTDIIQTTAATLDVLSGDLVEASTYYPNGAREAALVDHDDPSALEPNGFTGKEADEEVGLTYFGERYLIPRLGRWASADPLSIHVAEGGLTLNSYHYVGGNLLQVRDPLGLAPGDPDSKIQTSDQLGERTLRVSEPAGGNEMNFTEQHPHSAPDDHRIAAEDRMPIAPWEGGIQDGSGYRGGDTGAALGATLFNELRGHHPTDSDLLALGLSGHGSGLGGRAPRRFAPIELAPPALDRHPPMVGVRPRGRATQAPRGRAVPPGTPGVGSTAPASSGAAAHATGGGPTRLIHGVRVVDRRTGTVLQGTVDLTPTLDRIASGGQFPHRNDGSIFQNRPLPGRTTPELPAQAPGYYREYVHPTPGVSGPGPQRVVVGQGGEMFYTPDHYQTFIPLR